MLLSTGSLLLSAALSAPAHGLSLNLNDQNSIKQAASTIAYDMMTFYKGNLSGNVPGLLPYSGQPNGYYWWEGGAMFGTLIDYWYFTGDTSYNDVTTQAMLFQVGPYNNYEPPNETASLGNDDQAFWAISAMTAAEQKFPNPPADKPQWLALAQAVWNRQVIRWDTQYCNGGLRWQIYPFNAGWNYKNAISNGCFFHLGARLGKYTGNTTYLDWAEETWDWCTRIGIVDKDYNVFDGAGIEDNCTTTVPLQFSYNVGVFMYGAAAMWNASIASGNASRAEIWRDRIQGLINATALFFPNNGSQVMVEVACEWINTCDTDQHSFKAYLSRWMANTAIVAPWTYVQLKPRLEYSAYAAAKACSGGSTGTLCGFRWWTGNYDGSPGIGQQMNALEVIQSNLLQTVEAPADSATGISVGNASAGTEDPDAITYLTPGPPTAGSKAAAGILTAIVLGTFLGGAVWIVFWD